VAETTVASWIGTALVRDAGVSTVFGVVGSGNFRLANALTGHGARLVAARHEGAAAAMADAYARVSGEVGILTVHQGPGLTNALTGLAEAAKSRTPLLVLAAEAASRASGSHVDQAALAAAVGVLPDRVTAASTVRNDLRRAYRTALVERRTVLLSLPLDVQAQPLADAVLPEVRVWPRLWPAPESVAALADALARARRPLFLAGRGARQARQDLSELAERTGALLATSTAARGLFRGEEFSLDIAGVLATPAAAELIAGADLIVAWGCALAPLATRHGALISDDATVVQVDASPAALAAQHRTDLGIPSDTGTAARAVAAELARRGQRSAGYRTPEVARRLAAGRRWRDVPFQPDDEDGRIDPRTLTIALDDLLPAERTVATDSGHFMGYPAAFLDVPDEHGLVFSQSFQAVGLGLAAALGAAVARPDRLTVAALGDGGALMGGGELETAVRLGVRGLLVVVYDDEANGTDVHRFGPRGDPLGNVRFPPADLARIAAGYGCAAVTVRGLADLAPVRSWLDSDRARPLLIDAKVTSGTAAWWLPEVGPDDLPDPQLARNGKRCPAGQRTAVSKRSNTTTSSVPIVADHESRPPLAPAGRETGVAVQAEPAPVRMTQDFQPERRRLPLVPPRSPPRARQTVRLEKPREG
jgi:thiamine pyrophosphate-dependent acetolactate synthase large subunit-like protein